MFGLARKIMAFAFVLAALIGAANALAAERNIGFSTYVPTRSGDLTFGPTRAHADGFANTAGLRLMAGNAGAQKGRLHFEAFDAAFNPISDIQLPAPTVLYPGETRTFLAVVPIMQDVKNRIRICAILKAPSAKEKRMCGRYIGRKN